MESTRLLLLETSGRIGQVGLAEGATLRAVRRLDEVRRHARDLAPAVAELLAGLGWEPGQIEGVIVSRGPGSYTGLRVGIMSAKTFAFAAGFALLGVDTFAAIALQAAAGAASIDVLADAQQGKVYVQRFEHGAGQDLPEARTPLRIEAFAEWLARADPDLVVTGPALRIFRDRLTPNLRTAEEAAWEPRLESLLHLGLRRYQTGERDDVLALEPLYLRPSAAEEQWDRK